MLSLRNALRTAARAPIYRANTRTALPRLLFAAYASASALDKGQIQNRVLDVLKSFEKVDQAKLALEASFANDLGLDSLDAVEVVMAIEEEFGIEIPDAEADAISTVQQAVDYIEKTPEAR